MHLADAFIQSDLQCIQAIIFLFSFFLSMRKKRLHIFVLLGQHVKWTDAIFPVDLVTKFATVTNLPNVTRNMSLQLQTQ